MSKRNQQPAADKPEATPKDPALDQGTQDQSNDSNQDQADGRLLITLPADINEGITEVVAQLRATYTEVDVDKVLAERFAPELTKENVTSDLVLGEPRYELAFPLDVLGDDMEKGVLAVQTALDERRAPENTFFPEGLIGYEFKLPVLDRYVKGVLLSEKRLEDAELVFADPETDPYLKVLNFQRFLQGLPATHIYLRFL
jgi:hypothetical protein